MHVSSITLQSSYVSLHHHHLIHFPALLRDSPARLTPLASCERLMDEPPGPLTPPRLGLLLSCVGAMRVAGSLKLDSRQKDTATSLPEKPPLHPSLLLIFPSALHSSCGGDGTTGFRNPIVIISAFTICFEAFLGLRRCRACCLPAWAVF